MLKVKPPDGYPPEEGRQVRGNDCPTEAALQPPYGVWVVLRVAATCLNVGF
jgi:hypothetical protein